jgi:hypothetical protein
MMYTCEESELGGVRSVSMTDGGREIIAKKLAERDAARTAKRNPEPAERLPVSKGTPLGRAFRNFLG